MKGLIAAVQVGVLELHIWQCHIDEIEKPDWLVFDFDPTKGRLSGCAAARDMHDRPKKLGLNFAMVTGGKGVHVVAP